MRVLGIMNGTSLDGADFVLVNVDSESFSSQLIASRSFSFTKQLQQKLKKAAQHQMNVADLALLHHELGRFYANCFSKLTHAFKDVECIGLHGQTVFHKGKVATLQIGEPSYLAVEAQCKVVSDFRVSDIALGGEGAPLATFFHLKTFAQKNKTISIHNLGGISNLTLIEDQVVTQAYDTGPANMLLDLVIQKSTKNRKKYDADGKIAKSGKIDTALLKKMSAHKYFSKKPPKSCGREEFGEIFYQKYKKELGKLSLKDQLATLTELVAVSISINYQKFAPQNLSEIIFCGGGSNNKFLISRVQNYLPNITLTTTDDYGWPTQSIEAAAFAVLAAARVKHVEANLPLTTGAKRKGLLGKITQV